jgi:hypothetical protein
MKLGTETMTAEELAAVTAITDVMPAGMDIDLWAWARPRPAEAFAVALDNAVLYGIDAPATCPSAGW